MRKVRFFIHNLLGRFRYNLALTRKFFQEELVPSDHQWRWAAIGVLFLMGLFLLGMLFDFIGTYHVGIYLIALIYFLGIPLMIGVGIRIGLWILGGVSRKYGWIFFGAVFFISFSFYFPTRAMIAMIIFLLFAGSFIGGGIYNLTGNRWNELSKRGRTLSIFFAVLGIALFSIGTWYTLYPGKKPDEVKRWANEVTHQPDLLKATDPSGPGMYDIDSLTYGSGNDRHRPEFAEEASLTTPRVDGSNFIDGWDKISGKLRTFYWKVEPEKLPLNGRVWFPLGEGPFPLVLMVHGNHDDRDFSDPGYAYLGRHFASRGIIAVSVDQNFLNGAWSDFSSSLNTENDCRGWLLLKHLEQWDHWNRSDSSRFSGKVDLDRVVLIGHSRGGEAVSIASCFNQLPYYPDNAEEKFQFGYGIRGIAAIAPVDGQYYPAGIPTPVQNVNYFTIQGSMDSDLRDYNGLRQMRRVEFNDNRFHFAAGLYVHGANHGQFNQSWGKFDIDYPSYLMLNRRAIIPAVEQEKVALVYLTAFVEESVNPDAGYLDLFKDYRRGKEWLPDLVFLNQYHESSSVILCDYEEDINITTGTQGISFLESQELATWNEARIPKKWGNHRNSGVFLGWNNEKDSLPGYYAIHLDSAASEKIGDAEAFTFLVADAQKNPGDRLKTKEGEEGEPKSEEEEQTEEKNEKKDRDSDKNRSKKKKGKEEKEPFDFGILLIDSTGSEYKTRLGDFVAIQPALKPEIFKSRLFWDDPESEVIQQYVAIPLEEFRSETGETPEAGKIRIIKFVFDHPESGTIILDQIGFTRSD